MAPCPSSVPVGGHWAWMASRSLISVLCTFSSFPTVVMSSAEPSFSILLVLLLVKSPSPVSLCCTLHYVDLWVADVVPAPFCSLNVCLLKL